MPHPVVRYSSAENERRLEDILDDRANHNPHWEIVSVSHVLIACAITVAVVFKHVTSLATNQPTSANR